jgi:DNA-binding NarL/FixJ family response regulator
MYVIHDATTIETVLALADAGLSDHEVARQTGVSRSTVQNWRRFGVPEIGR